MRIITKQRNKHNTAHHIIASRPYTDSYKRSKTRGAQRKGRERATFNRHRHRHRKKERERLRERERERETERETERERQTEIRITQATPLPQRTPPPVHPRQLQDSIDHLGHA
ncbi:hypothetical protein ACMFMF_005535 [Clarireedia jacksonii]